MKRPKWDEIKFRPHRAPWGPHELSYADVFRGVTRRPTVRETIPSQAYAAYEALVTGALAACGLAADNDPPPPDLGDRLLPGEQDTCDLSRIVKREHCGRRPNKFR
jgi:hypothetical protein